jgi:hypothetical protein
MMSHQPLSPTTQLPRRVKLRTRTVQPSAKSIGKYHAFDHRHDLAVARICINCFSARKPGLLSLATLGSGRFEAERSTLHSRTQFSSTSARSRASSGMPMKFARRAANFVEVPNKHFPIEPHCLIPFPVGHDRGGVGSPRWLSTRRATSICRPTATFACCSLPRRSKESGSSDSRKLSTSGSGPTSLPNRKPRRPVGANPLALERVSLQTVDRRRFLRSWQGLASR